MNSEAYFAITFDSIGPLASTGSASGRGERIGHHSLAASQYSNPLATFSAPRVSTRSNVAALFVRCGRSERGRRGDRRGRGGDAASYNGYTREHRSDRSSIAKPPTAMQPSAAAPRRRLHRGSSRPRVVGNLISRRLCALRSKCNRATPPAAIALRRSRRYSRDGYAKYMKRSLCCRRKRFLRQRRMRGASGIPFVLPASFNPFRSPVAYKRWNTNLPWTKFSCEYPVALPLLWSINVYSLFCELRTIVSCEQICIKPIGNSSKRSFESGNRQYPQSLWYPGFVYVRGN